MGVTKEAEGRKHKFGITLVNSNLTHQIRVVREELEQVLDPDCWGTEDLSKETVTRIQKDIRKLRNFEEHINKMKTRY